MVSRGCIEIHAGFGAVGRTPEAVAHKLIGAESSFLSSKGFSTAAGTAACTDSHRQNICGLVHKSPRRCALQGAVQAGNESPVVGGLSLSPHQSSAHLRSPEPWGGHAFEERDSSRRVEATPRVSSKDLDPLQKSGCGFVCDEREYTLPALLLSVSLPAGRGCSDVALASSQTV